MAQRISELQRLRNELAQLKSPTQDNLSQSDINIPKDSAQKNTGSGFGYTLGKLWGGIVRSHEGWFDAAIAQAADIFGNDELAERVMKNDWMDYGKYDAKFNPGKGWEFTGDVASGVGNMLPAIALSFVPVVGAGLSHGWFTQSASGQAVSDAVKQTGELGNKEWAYGTASGLLEGAIEMASGGIGGTALFKDIGKKAGKTVLGKLAVNMAGEGAEEVASDIIDPILKRTTGVDDEAQMPTFGELGRTFAVGGVTGAVMGGGTTALQAAKVGGFNNLNAFNDFNELTERQADNNLRQTEGKKALYTEEDINRTKESLSKRLQKMDDTTRAEFLKRNARVAQMFNEDGTVKDFAPAPETYNTSAYSASLKGREDSFAYKPVADTSAISQEAKQVMNTLTKITGGNTNIVLTEDALTTGSGKSANGLYQDGVIYLNAKATDYDKALKVGIHEVVHGLEGTKEYNELAKYISQQIKNNPDLAQRYNIDAYRNAYDKLLKGEWTEDTKEYQAATEIFADYIGNVVAGNKTLLNNLVARNSNVFVRFLNWVRNSIAKLGESAEERKMRKDLQKLEKMLVEALQAGNGGITLEEVEDLARTAEKARKTQEGNVQSVKFSENKKADGKLATARASIQIVDGEEIVVIDTDQDIFDGVDVKDYPKVVKEYMRSKFQGKVLSVDDKKAFVQPRGVKEYAYPANRRMNESIKSSKMKAGTELDNLLKIAKYIGHESDDGRHPDAVRGWDKYKTKFIVDGRKFEAEVSIKLIQRGDVFHDVSKIKDITPGTNGKDLNSQSASRQGDVIEGKPSNPIITEKSDLSSENAKKVEKTSTSRASIDINGIDDFPSIDKWFESLTVEELRELIDNDSSINDISEELNVEPSKLRILMRREGLGKAYAVDGKDAVMKQSRINEAIEDSGATNPTYARRYITRISTKDFIDLTVREDHMDREAFDKEVIGDHGSKMGEYDYEKALQTSRTPYLSIDKASGQVISHNGRHRIRALEKAGIQSVEIEVDFFDEDGRLIKYDAETIPKMAISSQFDTDIEITISNVIPLNESHRTDIEKAYGEKAHPKAGVRYSLNVTEQSIKEAETDRAERKTSSARFSLKYANEIAERQFKDNEKFGFHVTDEKLNEAIESTARMVDMMSKHLDILPEDKIGKKNETIKSNSSYDKSIENTTICVRTLSYNQFVDKVQERLGRPLTQAESFLASQKLYEIAVDPQCLYCYVSLDRKAYNEFLLRYINERDEVIEKYNHSNKSKKAVEKLYEEYRNNRKDTDNMRKRFNMFIEMAGKGIKPLSAKDVSTKARQSEIASRNDYTSVQWKDMAAYAQSASWAKKQQDYVAYFNDILNLSKVAVDNLNKHYGLRFYSFSDYTAAFIVENMQQVTDAAIRGLKGLGYTKDVDFARIFAPTGMNINISMYAHINKETGEWEIDPRQSANLEDAIKLRDEYPNVGIVVTASTDEGVDWALKQKWSDVVIPFHIVRTGADVAEFYNWQNYTTESADTIADEKLWNAYVNGRKKVSKNIYPAEHQNNKETYLKLIKERGLKPRFERFLDNPNYMKLVNETRQSAKDTKPMQPTFDVDAAEKSFNAFVGKGGYFKGWYKQGVNVDAEADAVAKDVAEGKKANEVDYGRQDIDTEALMKKRTAVRTHSRASLDAELDKKTTERVQTAVSNMTMAERWQKVLEDLKLGKADQWIKAQIAWTDEQAGIIQAGKNVGVVVHGEVQRARVAKASAINMLNDSQRDYSGKKRVGDSLKAIFKPIQSRGKKVAQDFNLYLLHQLNVDRMSAEETAIAKRKELLKKFPDLDNAVNGRYANDAEWQSAVKSVDGGKEYLSTFDAENKPVFEKDVDKAFSQEKVQQLEKQYPEFKATAEKVWKYNQNLLQYRVDAGLITQAQADQMTKMYPHYVPAFYEHNGGGTSGAFVGQKGVAVKTGIKSAKGSTGVSNIEDVQTSIARQTVAVIRAASINKIVEKLYDGAMKTKNFVDFEIVGKESMTDPDVNYDTDIPKENQVFFYKDGERITLDVSQYIYAGFRGLTAGAQLGDPITTLSAKGINLFKKLVTSWNPLFAVTNAVRDAQEALFYTKYGKRFFANYGKALVTRKSDPRLKELWEQYKAMGGTGSGYFSRDTGVFDDSSKLRKGVEWLGDKMQIVNEWVEQAPRFAEFVASVEAGNSLEQALYDSAEVTTNFSRGGKMAKALNRHLIPFLNPSIQGWSKMWRGWVAPMDGKSAAEIERLSKQSKGRRFLSNYGALMFKAILCGVSVGLFNDMLYRWIDDDEDYANLPLNIKENYYLIKVGKKFIKIPKGRVVALYGSAWTRLSEAMNGNEDALNAWDWAKSASEMVSPLESAFRSIIAPVRDVQTNTTWYGGQIENASMENLAPSERYDEGTSKIAIAMGKAFNYSPKKIHYILDQYSGVIGDVILPLTTNKAEKNMVSARFVVDPLYNSDVSTKYYDYKEELTFAKNSGDTNAKLMLKYMNEVQDDLSKMYQQKRDIANDKSLTNKEKREQTEIIQGLINATLSSSVDMADEFEQALIDNKYEQAVAVLTSSKAYTKLDEKSQTYASNKMNEYYYEMCKAEVSGTKPSMKYALYTSMNAPDLVVYLSNINNIEADKDKKGNTISGSRKEKVHKYIQGLRLSVQQKNILMYLAGYKPTDAGQKTVEAYLTKQGYTAKEVDELWSN